MLNGETSARRSASKVVASLSAALLVLTFGYGAASAVEDSKQLASHPDAQSLVVVYSAGPVVADRSGYTVERQFIISWPFPPSTIASTYGPRTGCAAGCSTFHDGVDFSVAEGTVVRSVAGGVVTAVGADPEGYGVFVVVQHESGHATSLYGHLLAGSPLVQVGQSVATGQPLGAAGSTGVSTGNHLHLEVRVAGELVDPEGWLYRHAR